MHKFVVGLTALSGVAFAGPALGESETERIQETEQPGSEFELNVDSGGNVEFGRKGKLDLDVGTLGEGESNPLEIGDSDPLLEPLDDPDLPVSPDAIDAELPGEGPESLSGPDDDDPLPY